MFINSIIWYKNQGQHMIKQCMQSHDVIYAYSNTGDYIFNIQREVYKLKGGTYNYHLKKYGLQAAEDRHKLGTEITTLWVSQNIRDGDYPTQKTYKLLERVICLSTI